MTTEAKEDKYAIHAAAREGRCRSILVDDNLGSMGINTDQHIVPIVESLLRADPKLAFRKDEDGRLPIHWAVSANQFDIVSILVQVKNFDPDVQDDLGWTPLMIAVSVKDGEKIVDLLLDKGADVNEKSKFSSSHLTSHQDPVECLKVG
jgi:26S proteasome non-ATPase regulatory subunit 10